MIDKIDRLIISRETSVLSALKKMDEQKRKLLIVVDHNGVFYRLLSIGDIQRAIIANVGFDSVIDKILRDETKVAFVKDDIEQVKQAMRERRIEFMPIIDQTKKIVDVLFWEDLFPKEVIKGCTQLNLPVVIMAGGKGSRLAPLTHVLPKPLIPIQQKSMLEDIMDQFVAIGCHNFYLSVNYKAEMIEYYMNSLNNPDYILHYFKETKPLGTAGSLHLLKDKIKETFFVSNCDILIDQDYSEIVKYHRENNNEITVVAALKQYHIPYGTIETMEDGMLNSITEKPDLIFKINAGLYVLEPHLIEEIPVGEFYHITYLIEKLRQSGRNVGVFPVSEGSWTDIGNWSEYIHCIGMDL